MSGLTAHSYRVTATLDGVDLGVFESHSGFEQDSDGQKIWPGGGGPQEALAAPATVGDGTVVRTYRPERDDQFLPALRSRVGKGDVVVVIQPLNAENAAAGKRRTITGKLKGLKEPESESGSGDPAKIEISVLSHGTVGS